MTENPDAPDETSDLASAGTNCALCGKDLSPNQYPNCRAVLIDENVPDGTDESVWMVCEDCWAELDDELTEPSE